MIYTMAVLSGLLGVIALYYPKVADAWNRYVQGRNVGKYVESVNDIDYEKEMDRIQAEMKEVLEQEKKSQQMLEDAFRGIGYGID